LIALFLTGPFLWLLSTALKPADQDIFALDSFKDILPKKISFESFQTVWTAFKQPGQEENKLYNYFRSTIIIVGFSMILQLLIASMAAYPLARLDFPGKNFISVVLLSTLMLPVQANMIVNFITIRKLGLFDTYAAVILPGAVTVFGIFLMRQAYLVIPAELEDAARIDGAGEMQIWYGIMLPITRSSLATLAIFSFVTYWNSFMWPLVILKSEKLYPISVGLSYLANTFETNFRLISAASVLAMLPVMIIFLILQKQFVKGVTSGAIK
ncbi:MAG: carbohydrate ABC transporter permease, partial [Vulcanimicrobiota bacterium]